MRRAWMLALALLLVGVLTAAAVAWRAQGRPAPSATMEGFTLLGRRAHTVGLTVEAQAGTVRTVEIHVVQGETDETLLSETLESGETTVERSIVLDAKALGLAEGPAELRVLATDDAWRPKPPEGPRLVHSFAVDLTPPVLELRGATGYLRHAAAGVAIYRARDASMSGIRSGGRLFRGTPGLAADPEIHVALFTLPYDQPAAAPTLEARDEAGNERVVGVLVELLPTALGTDTVRLTDSFLGRKVPELALDTPATAPQEDLLAAFLVINGEGRREAEERIAEITARASADRPLWSGPFRQQPRTKVFAGMAKRTYERSGKEVDSQWHLGIDLASSQRAPILAGNAGRVLFTGPIGIYGNTVLLDHGLGLVTLHAHLSEIHVQEGQEVAQGEALGLSGQTGLAGGDHLHHAFLVQGVYTSPLDWWDAAYLRDRIAKPLREAGLFIPGVTDIGEVSTGRRR